MPLFENCRSIKRKSKTGKYDENPFILNVKAKIVQKNCKEINSNGKGITKKVVNPVKFNKHYSTKVISKTGFIDDNKWMSKKGWK